MNVTNFKRNILLAFFLSLFLILPKGIIAQDTIPILAWYSIPAESATIERYEEMRDAGFNITFSHTQTLDEAVKALDLSAAVGIKSIFTCWELVRDAKKTVEAVKDHPGLAGYFLRDEPVCADFSSLTKWADTIKSVDNAHYCYLNLFPSFVSPEALGDTYRGYVQRFIKEVDLPFVSFDCYPIINNNIRPDWYENLEIIAEESKKANRPFWAFALSTAHNDYPIPTLAHLRVQQYTNLAYGAQGLQYFTYWNPDTLQWDFHEAPITLQKKRSPVYDLIRSFNKELQNRAFVFMGAEVKSVYHTGNEIPKNTTRMENLPKQIKKLDTNGDHAVVSILEKGKYRYLVIVNSNLDKSLDLSIEFNNPTDLVRKDGSIEPTEKYGDWYRLEPGYAEIFRWEE